jgi:hypothetical protein
MHPSSQTRKLLLRETTKASLSATFHVTVFNTTSFENWNMKQLFSMDSVVSLFYRLAVAFNSCVLL